MCNKGSIRNKGGRRIIRWVDEDLLDEMERRVQEDPEKMRLRKRLAEHPFGTIKHHWGQGHFPWPGQDRLTRKLPNVGAEMALTVLSYNIKRAIKILGVQNMIEALVGSGFFSASFNCNVIFAST
jgi:hypothetical protein